MKSVAAAAIVGLALLPSFASAEMPATIRGVVYSCDTGAPIGGAYVRLTSLDDRSQIVLVTDPRGSFARVGLSSGRYLVIVVGEISGSSTAAVSGVSRLASVDTDDVLDVRIGTHLTRKPPPDPHDRDLNHVDGRRYVNEPTTICDAPVVPAALPMSDRYTVR